MQETLNKEEIINYYDHCQVDYEIVWHLKNYMCMHYGYWDASTPNLRSALNNMNVRLAEYAGIKPGAHVLDAGCGVGGSSIFLAKNLKCHTTGITLSEKQVATCQGNAALHGVADLCTFREANYLDTGFPDNSFDVVWAVESVCYAYNKIDFLKEAYRVLKPGGKVIVADFYSNNLMPGTADQQIMDKWTRSWAIKSYAEVAGFRNDLHAAGFTACREKDVTANVLKSIQRLYYSFFPGLVSTYVGQFLGRRNKLQTANTWSTYYQYKTYKKNLWRYMFFSGSKPLL